MKDKIFNLIVPNYQTIDEGLAFYIKYSKNRFLYWFFKKQFESLASSLQYDIAVQDRGINSFI